MKQSQTFSEQRHAQPEEEHAHLMHMEGTCELSSFAARTMISCLFTEDINQLISAP